MQLQPQASSQSLSSRAMSFDLHAEIYKDVQETVSIPFEQGDVFRLISQNSIISPIFSSQSLSSRAMSFDKLCGRRKHLKGLNPFRAGRCLSTKLVFINSPRKASQSLSSRAMSFDEVRRIVYRAVEASQSLSSRAMSFDKKFKMRFVFL